MNIDIDTADGYSNDIHKRRIIKYKPKDLETMKTANYHNSVIVNTEDKLLEIHYSYLEIDFIVSDNADGVFWE